MAQYEPAAAQSTPLPASLGLCNDDLGAAQYVCVCVCVLAPGLEGRCGEEGCDKTERAGRDDKVINHNTQTPDNLACSDRTPPAVAPECVCVRPSYVCACESERNARAQHTGLTLVHKFSMVLMDCKAFFFSFSPKMILCACARAAPTQSAVQQWEKKKKMKVCIFNSSGSDSLQNRLLQEREGLQFCPL